MLHNVEFCVWNTKQMCHIIILFHSFFMIKIESNIQVYCFYVKSRPKSVLWAERSCRADCWNCMGTERVPLKGALSGRVCFACRTGFLFWIGCSSWPSTKYFFPHHYTISIHLSLLRSKLGRQSCWVACLLKCLCLWRVAFQDPLLSSKIRNFTSVKGCLVPRD
jgi:hypothetical protein